MTAAVDTGHGLVRHGGRKLSDYFVFNTDHKVIGIQYMVLSFLFFIFGGILAELIRAELARPGTQFVGGSSYNQLFTIHGTIMIFLWIIPAFAGLANYVIPLQLGANDMAFPRLNALAFWLLIPGAILLLFGFWVGGAESGWTAYPPLSLQTGTGQTIWAIALQFIGFSSIFGAINFMVTIFNMRAHGHDADAAAVDGLGDHLHLDHHHPGHAGALRRAGDAGGQPHPGRQLLRRLGRRRPADVAEPVLVLLAPGGVYHDPARLRHHLRGAAGLLPQADLRL